MSGSISTSYGFSTHFSPVLMIPNEQREDGGGGGGGCGEEDKRIGILFWGMMGKDIWRKTVQEERKRTSILPVE